MEDPPNRFLQKQVAALMIWDPLANHFQMLLILVLFFLECDVVLNFLHIIPVVS